MQTFIFATILAVASAAVVPHKHSNITLGATYGGTFALYHEPTCTTPLISAKVSGDCTETYSAFQGDYAAVAIFPNAGGLCGTASSCVAFCGATTSNDCKTDMTLALNGNASKVPANCFVGGLADCQPLPQSGGVLFFEVTPS